MLTFAQMQEIVGHTLDRHGGLLQEHVDMLGSIYSTVGIDLGDADPREFVKMMRDLLEPFKDDIRKMQVHDMEFLYNLLEEAVTAINFDRKREQKDAA